MLTPSRVKFIANGPCFARFQIFTNLVWVEHYTKYGEYRCVDEYEISDAHRLVSYCESKGYPYVSHV